MTRYITGILILLLVSVATSQAQRKEPEIKGNVKRQIEKLKKAPDNVTFARELYNTGIYCLDRGMYDEAALARFTRRRLQRAGHRLYKQIAAACPDTIFLLQRRRHEI